MVAGGFECSYTSAPPARSRHATVAPTAVSCELSNGRRDLRSVGRIGELRRLCPMRRAAGTKEEDGVLGV
ncbi:MAG: hypothetical protein ACRDJ3_11640, partial [Solirubrobacteraceae bacterium]